MFFYTGVSNQMYKDKYIKKRDQKLTGLNNQKKIIFQNLSKIMSKHHSFLAKNSN